MDARAKTAEVQAKIKSSKKDGLRNFMDSPLARAMISMLPPSEHLEVVLRAAYESGFDHGSGTVVGELAGIIISSNTERP